MPTSIDHDGVRRLLAEGALLLDALPPEEYAAEHLAGALSMPLEDLTAAAVAGWDRNRPVVVYCWDAG